MYRWSHVVLVLGLVMGAPMLVAADVEDAKILLEGPSYDLHLSEREHASLVSEIVMALRSPIDAPDPHPSAVDPLPLCTIRILTNRSTIWRTLSMHYPDQLVDQDDTRYHFRYGLVVFDAIQRKTIDTQDWTPIK